MNQEVMKLYKQYGINPVGGCLPMMIQIPFSSASSKCSARRWNCETQSFFERTCPAGHHRAFADDWLADQHHSAVHGCDTGLAHGDDTEDSDPTQRRIAMFMPLIFLFICYNFAAALALYYTAQTSSVFCSFIRTNDNRCRRSKKLRLPQSENDDDAERSARHDARLPRFRRANRGDHE